MALVSTPCKLGDVWCLYTDQSWDCAGGDWQIITGDGKLVAWMFTWHNDGLLYAGGNIKGVKHYSWNDPEVREFKAEVQLSDSDIMRIWCDVRVDRDGYYRENSKVIEWEDLLGDGNERADTLADSQLDSVTAEAVRTSAESANSITEIFDLPKPKPTPEAP